MARKQFKEISIIAYETVDGTCRIEYKGYVIQTYGYRNGSDDIPLIHFIIDPDGLEVGEKDCLLKCIAFIDRKVKRESK